MVYKWVLQYFKPVSEEGLAWNLWCFIIREPFWSCLVIPTWHNIPQSIIILSYQNCSALSFILYGHQRIFVSAKLIASGINAAKGLVSVRSLKVVSLSKFQISIGLNLFKPLFPTLGENKSYHYSKLPLIYQFWRYQSI